MPRFSSRNGSRSSQSGLTVVAAAAGILFGLARPPVAWTLDLLASTDGAAAGDMLGDKVADAGDLNGDGRRDYAAAANASDVGGVGSGQVLVFLGAYPPNGVPEFRIAGQAGDLLGSGLAAGDFNGDGFDDLAIGSWRNSTAGSQAGKVLVFFGGASPDTIPDRTLFGAAPGAHFGQALAGAGDLNGDGIADLVVGAPGIGAGRVFIYYGGNSFDTIADLILDGAADGERFGIALASPGDLTGDGEDDLAVGADRADLPATWAGAVRIFAGGPGIDTTSDLTLLGETAGSFFGGDVSGAGDFDGDGNLDLVVGAKGFNGPNVDSGRSYLFLGGPGFDAVPDLTITGQGYEEFSGTAVAGGGDLNRDGKADLIVGAPGADGNRGVARVYFGGLPLDATADVLLPGEVGGDEMGFSVALVRDSDRNGAAEVLVGAWAHASNAGRIYLYGDSAPPIGIEPTATPAISFTVGSVRPNPSLGNLELPITIDEPSRVLVDLFDVEGRLVARLLDRHYSAGSHVLGAGARAPAGLYLLRVTRGSDSHVRKLVLLP